jgi:hypothetical protein
MLEISRRNEFRVVMRFVERHHKTLSGQEQGLLYLYNSRKLVFERRPATEGELQNYLTEVRVRMMNPGPCCFPACYKV